MLRPAGRTTGRLLTDADLKPRILRTPGYVSFKALADSFAGGDFNTELDARAADGGTGVWSKLSGRFDVGATSNLSSNDWLWVTDASGHFVAGASALYSLASGLVYFNTRAELVLSAVASSVASGQQVELWSKMQPASQVATVGVRAKLVVGPSAAISLALLSHDGSATTLHASMSLATTHGTMLWGGQDLKLVLETFNGEGRVWLGTAGAAGSPLLNPSHANLAMAGNPALGAKAGGLPTTFWPYGPLLKDFQYSQFGSAPDTDAREWFRFESDPQERAIQSNSTVFRYDRQANMRGVAPRIPPVGSPAATGPAQLVILTGEVDNFVGNDPFDVQLTVRERFTFLR
jgi:hypothetical protein